ncbi:MAG TPA: biotin/lipoyl-containing protein [bacterium]|nr:biotin/lipoyl-containing protein [bacterium]
MKEYRYEINGKTFRVRIKEMYGEHAVVEVNNQTYQVNMMLGQVTAAPKGPLSVPGGALAAAAAPASEAATSADKSAAAPAPAPSAVNGAVKAPMPGVILKIKVNEGDMVNAGDAVMVIEAMKMENDIKAPRSGTVKKIMVGQGDSVNTGDNLLFISD